MVTPIPMILFCPMCGVQHIDAPETHHLDLELDRAGMDGGYSASWDNPPHRSHLCHACGCIWRPADVPTTGVAKIETRGNADTFDPGNGRELVREAVARIERDLTGKLGVNWNGSGREGELLYGAPRREP